MIGRLRDACQELLRKPPEDAFTDVLAPLAKRGEAPAGKKAPPPDVAPADAAAVLAELEGLLGKPSDESTPDAPGALVRRLREASEALVADWGQKLSEMSVRLIEEPEFRLAGAEEAIRQVVASVEQILQHQEPLARELAAEGGRGLRPVAGLRRGQARRPAAAVVGRRRGGVVAGLPEMAVPEPGVAAGVVGVFEPARPPVRRAARDQFLPGAAGGAATPLGGAAGHVPVRTAAGRLVLPAGCKDLGEAVDGFLAAVGPEALLELDGRVQEVIRSQFTALVHICLASGNLLKNVGAAMLGVAREFADEVVGETNAAEMFLEQHPDEGEAEGEASGFFAEAQPELSPGPSAAPCETCVLAAPPGEAGDRFRALTRRALPDVELLPAVSEDDILFYREISNLPLAELEQLGAAARDAYRQMSAAEDFTPHTRIDVDFGAAAPR